MADITVSVGSNLAEKALQDKAKSAPSGGDSPFEKLLNQKLDAHPSQQIFEAFGKSPEQQMKSVSAEGLKIEPTQIQVNSEIKSNGKVADMLSEVNRGALQMEEMMKVMTSGKQFSAGELLYFQANMADIVMRTEMSMKVGEQMASSFKQINQTQI